MLHNFSIIEKLMEQLIGALKRTEFVCKIFYIFAGVALLVLFLLMFIDVSLRFLFNSPIVGTSEVSEYILVSIAFLGLGYAQFTKQHIFVEILTSRFPKKVRAVLNIILMLLATGFFIIMTMETGNRAYKDLIGKVLLPNTTVKLPVWWISAIAALGCALLAITLLVGIVDTAIKLKKSEKA